MQRIRIMMRWTIPTLGKECTFYSIHPSFWYTDSMNGTGTSKIQPCKVWFFLCVTKHKVTDLFGVTPLHGLQFVCVCCLCSSWLIEKQLRFDEISNRLACLCTLHCVIFEPIIQCSQKCWPIFSPIRWTCRSQWVKSCGEDVRFCFAPKSSTALVFHGYTYIISKVAHLLLCSQKANILCYSSTHFEYQLTPIYWTLFFFQHTILIMNKHINCYCGCCFVFFTFCDWQAKKRNE